MFKLLITAAAAYILVVAFMYVFQRRLMYLPNKAIGTPEQYGLIGFTELFTTTPDGISLQLWYRPADPGFPTVIYYHGNAYNIGNRSGIYGALAGKGFGVLAPSYRGFGKSTGRPSEQGLYTDARAAVAFLAEKHIPPERIILFGESMGTGVAVQMATEYNVGGIVLQAAYMSVVGRAAEIYRYIPVRRLIKDQYDSIGKIPNVKAPLLLCHGELDRTIPISHGKALFAAATSPKHSLFFPHISHNDFDSETISSHVLDFARKYNLIES